MPTIGWLKQEFDYGYSSGSVISWLPNPRRRHEERQIGGSYRRFFKEQVQPRIRPDDKVLELGPGRGSWSRALLGCLPHGELHVCDFQDVSLWLKPQQYSGRLVCHQVSDNSFDAVDDGYFDLFFSVGVLCHNNVEHLRQIMANSRRKVKPGGIAIQHYADWHKLDGLGWASQYNIPSQFKDQSDDQVWWPRNDTETMANLCTAAGWTVVRRDLGCFSRDSVILLENPG